jgi:predicted RNase H-like nuclease (RuvC/YqgF family)
VNQPQSETEVGVVNEVDITDSLLKGFWERVHILGELVKKLRSDNRELTIQVEQLENELHELRSKVHEKDLEYRRLRSEYDQISSAPDKDFISSQEREDLKDKIRELISKINSHL